MPKKLDLPIVKRTLNCFEGDTETIDRFYPIGWSVVCRQLIHNHAKRLLEKEARSEKLNDRSEIAAITDELDIGTLLTIDGTGDDGDDGDDDQPELPLDD